LTCAGRVGVILQGLKVFYFVFHVFVGAAGFAVFRGFEAISDGRPAWWWIVAAVYLSILVEWFGRLVILERENDDEMGG
jgi:hypothetical protein